MMKEIVCLFVWMCDSMLHHEIVNAYIAEMAGIVVVMEHNIMTNIASNPALAKVTSHILTCIQISLTPSGQNDSQLCLENGHSVGQKSVAA
jgi:hypothetical protein